MSVKDTNNTDKVLKQLESLFKKEITVGLHGDVAGDIKRRTSSTMLKNWQEK